MENGNSVQLIHGEASVNLYFYKTTDGLELIEEVTLYRVDKKTLQSKCGKHIAKKILAGGIRL